jgi:hypothetical protein
MMSKEQFEKWMRDIIKNNLENLVGLAPTLGPSEKYSFAHKMSQNLSETIMIKISEIE